MTGIGERIHDAAERLGADWEADVDRVRQWTGHPSESSGTPHPSQQEEQMTETTTAPAAPFWSAVHQNLETFTSRMEAFLPKLRDVATKPWLDTLIEAGLAAAGQPEADAVFTGTIAILNAHANGENVGDVILDLLKVVMHKSPPAPVVPRAAAPAAVRAFQAEGAPPVAPTAGIPQVI